MAGRRVQPPPAVRALAIGTVQDLATQRALDQVSDAVQTLQTSSTRVVVRQDLAVGRNVVRHGLGRAAQGYTVTPTFATIAFGHALDDSNPNPDREIWIDVVGSDQPRSRMEIW